MGGCIDQYGKEQREGEGGDEATTTDAPSPPQTPPLGVEDA